MRVLYLITLAERGGAQVHVADLLRGFSSQFEIALGTGEDGYLCDVARELQIPVFQFPITHPIRLAEDMRSVAALFRLVRNWKPDLIHAHTSKAGMIARVVGLLTSTPVVFTAHTWSFAGCFSRSQQALSIPLERLAARTKGRIIAVSEANRELAAQHRISRPDKVITIWNGIDDVALRSNPGASEVPRIVMVARFAKQKDQTLLVRALRNVQGDFELVFVGDGPLREAVEAEAKPLGTRVRFLGERTDVAEILSGAHIFVLASRWEGLPLSILEAMRAGLPVVASNVGGVAEAVSHETSGFLVPADNETELRSRLQQLIGSSELRRRMGMEGRRRFEADFTLDRMLLRTAAVYREVLPEYSTVPEYFPVMDKSNETLT